MKEGVLEQDSPGSSADIGYMKMCLRLARRAAGRTSPNPMVGAVVVRDGAIVGKGYHRRAGLPHAEVEALGEAGDKARGSILYVNLEPCNFHGRTPPCTDLILACGVKEVVCATTDPTPRVSGRGVEQLRREGVEVRVGILEEEARRLNEARFCYSERGRPFVTLKAAATWDGKIATRERERGWFTSEAARREVHRMRSEVDAILIGIGTALNDDPLLTVREVAPKRRGFPIRVVLDSQARLPLSSRLVQTAREVPVLVACTAAAEEDKRIRLEAAGVETVVLEANSSDGVDVPSLLSYLAGKEIISVLVEGGAEVNWSFLAAGAVDKVCFFLAPLLAGGRDAPTPVGGAGIGKLAEAFRFARTEYKRIGPDLLLTGWLH